MRRSGVCRLEEALGVDFKGGDGSSIESAIIIGGVSNEIIGVRCEYEYIGCILGKEGVEWNRTGQALMRNEDRSYDRINVELTDGTPRVFYFDITGFFGKL